MMTLEQWLDLYFKEQSRVTLKWYWEPYHFTGLKALQWAQNHQWNEEKLREELTQLSVVSVPQRLKDRLKKHTDPQGRLMPLDPAPKILETWRCSKRPDFFAAPVREIKKHLAHWTPIITSERTHGLSPWEKLEFQESYEGLTNSHTTLEFQRIDVTSDIS